MKTEDTADGSLLITHDGTAFTKVLLILTALCAGTAAYDVFVGSRGTDRLVGLLASAATCGLAAIGCLETASFQFARPTRVVTWRRRWGLRERSGSMAFGSIQAVLAERPVGDDGVPSRRITLKTSDGQTIPITVGYRPDSDGSILTIAGRIRTLLGHDGGETHERHVKALVDAGKIVEAIRVLRQEEGISLLDAKLRVEELVRESSPDVCGPAGGP